MEFSYRLSVAAALLLTYACSSPDSSSEKVAVPVQQDNVDEVVTPGSIRQTPERVRELTIKARGGDIDAMMTLASHHITASETVQARYWLGEAVRHGDCYAVELLLEESYLRVPPADLPHWRNEQRRIGCDPNKEYFEKGGHR
jgi:hypothetical protein